MSEKIRNIAIIAHVDHGKTTLIDSILKQTGVFEDHQKVDERLMDSGDLEKERGITILAKPTSINWNSININIIDTPGHADFGGEVERVLDMTDGVILLIDASEGPMPQTKFVLGKALNLGLRPIVVINKVDKKDSRPDEVLDEIFDLFVSLDANDEQLDFPVLYASGRDGWCVKELTDNRDGVGPLLDLVIQHVKAPDIKKDEPFAMLVTLLDSDEYVGRCLVGKVYQGGSKVNSSVKAIDLNGNLVENGRLTKLYKFEGMNRTPVNVVNSGDIICIAGLTKASVADTICDISHENPLKTTPIDPPTMSITISINDSPLSGLEGNKLTSTLIRERLLAEAETNVAISFSENANKDSFVISGRGELQLGVLIETMRREGFELTVSRPQVLFRKDDQGEISEPIEEVTIDIDEEYSNSIVDSMIKRKAEMVDMNTSEKNKTRIIFNAPSRGLIGYQNKFLTETKGTGVLNRIFKKYEPFKGVIQGRKNGVLIAMDTGTAVSYAIFNLQDRGTMFVKPQTNVYGGMIVGENSKENDLEVNILKGKKLTNVRAAGSDKNIMLTPPRLMSLEQTMAYLNDDECLEVTPKNLRLRKKFLCPNERKRFAKTKNQIV